MNFRTCTRESEVVAVVKAGQWPEACDPALRAHVEGCSACKELILVKLAFMNARASAVQEAPLQSPGLLWWRAQLIRRDEALKKLDQPVSIAGTFALLSTLSVAIGLLLLQWKSAVSWLRWLEDVPNSESFRMATLWHSSTGWSLMLLIPCVISLALLGCFALYLASER